MLAYKNRFHGHGSLRYVYSNGSSVRTQKITVVVSKKVLKSAVGRNRIRRRVYEIIRHELPKIDGTFDVAVMIFHKSVKDISHEELKENIVNTFKEADFYCNK